MNGGGYTAAYGLDALDFDFLNGASSSAAQQQQQQQQMAATASQHQYLGPNMEGYNPETTAPTGASTYNPTATAHSGREVHGNNNNNTNNNIHHHRHHHNHHHHHHHAATTHQLLVSVGAGYPGGCPEQTMAALLAAPGGAGNAYGAQAAAAAACLQPSRVATASAAAAPSTASRQLALNAAAAAGFDPLPMEGLRAAANSSSIHPSSSFDDLLLLSSSLLGSTSRGASRAASPGLTASSLLEAGLDPYAATVSSGSSSNNSNSALLQQLEAINHHNASLASSSEPWMDELEIDISSLSLEPMSARSIVQRLQDKMNDVRTRYLPCVDFLVQCQQELRKGLAFASQKQAQRSGRRTYYRETMTPRQFCQQYVEPLPQRFLAKNQFSMEKNALNDAVQGISKLVGDAKNSCSQGSEAVKNSFLGGMKEGESWGLRKWLSRNGNALSVCTDLECILKACKALDQSEESTKKLAKILRPMAKQTLDRLKKDVPASYQEYSTAHPYLPFFHRLDAALRGMTHFDPDDGGVICLDDSDDDDDEIVVVAAPPPRKRKAAAAAAAAAAPPPKRASKRQPPEILQLTLTDDEDDDDNANDDDNGAHNDSTLPEPEQTLHATKPVPQRGPTIVNNRNNNDSDSSSGESEDESVIEIVDVTQTAAAAETNARDDDDDWRCPNCLAMNLPISKTCIACGEENMLHDLGEIPPPEELIGMVDSFDDALTNNINKSKKKSRATKGTKRPRKRKDTIGPKPANDAETKSHLWPVPARKQTIREVASAAANMADNLDQLAFFFEEGRESEVRPPSAPRGSFWDGERYADAIRLVAELLRCPEVAHFCEQISEDKLIQAGSPPYSHIIKHPLCFRDITSSLIRDVDEDSNDYITGESGNLPRRSLNSWNMWRGMDLLQAVDLVFLNSLAYGKLSGEGRSRHRARTNEMRKLLWNRIQGIVSIHVGDQNQRRKCTPTRRSETSGFVVYKIKER